MRKRRHAGIAEIGGELLDRDVGLRRQLLDCGCDAGALAPALEAQLRLRGEQPRQRPRRCPDRLRARVSISCAPVGSASTMIGGAAAARLVRQRNEGRGVLGLMQFEQRQPDQDFGALGIIAAIEQRQDRLVQQPRYPHHIFGIEGSRCAPAVPARPDRNTACAFRYRPARRSNVRAARAPIPRGRAAPASAPSGWSPAWCPRRRKPVAPRGAYGCRAGRLFGNDRATRWTPSPVEIRRPIDRADWLFGDSHWRHPVRLTPYKLTGKTAGFDTRIRPYEQPDPGDRFRQRRPFHRPLFDADFCCRRHRDGAGARHGLFRIAALCDPRLHRVRRGIADHRLARRPLEPPPHDGDLLLSASGCR